MGRPGKVNRAFIAASAGLAIGYVVVLIRDCVDVEIVMDTDFTVYWSAWHLILHGRAAELYSQAAQRSTQQLLMGGRYFEGGLMAFLNPPHFALATLPVGWLADHAGERTAFIAWALVNAGLLVVLIRMLLDEWGPFERPQHRVMLVAAVLAFYPVFVTLRTGELSLLLTVALLGFHRAARVRRPWIAGAWLTVLTIKPQLVPLAVIYLVARRSWRVLGASAALTAAVAATTALALGPMVWIDYARHVHYLEQFWGSGTPDYMLNARGELTRVLGLDHAAEIDVVAYAMWLGALAAAVAVVCRRRLDRAADTRMEFAFVMAVGLFANPHLFIHDTLLWTVPLLLCAAALRDSGRDWQRFARFALAWPLAFAVAGRLDIRSGLLTLFDLHTWMFGAAITMIARHLPPAEGAAPLPARARVPSAVMYRSWTS